MTRTMKRALGAMTLVLLIDSSTVMTAAAAGTDVFRIPTDIPSAPQCSPTQPDATPAIQAWLDSLPNGATAQFSSRQCYRTEGTIIIRDRRTFTVDGRGSKLQAFTDGEQVPPYSPSHERLWPRNRSRVTLMGNNIGIVIKRLHVDGGHPNPGPDGGHDSDLEAQHAFEINGSRYVQLQEVRGDRVFGDFVYISDSHGVEISKSAFGTDNGANSGNGRQGIAIVSGSDITFRRNDLFNVRRSIIDIEANSSTDSISDVTIERNTFGPARLNFFANGGADARIENIVVRDNRLQGKAFGAGIVTPGDPDPSDPNSYRRRNYQFINNVTDTGEGTPYQSLVRVDGVEGVVFSGNDVKSQAGRSMAIVSATRVRNISIIGNTNRDGTETARYEVTVGACEQGNRIGNPLVLDPSPGAPSCRGRGAARPLASGAA